MQLYGNTAAGILLWTKLDINPASAVPQPTINRVYKIFRVIIFHVK